MSFEVQRVHQLLQEIKRVCKSVQRNSEDITVLAALKYLTLEQSNLLVSAGIRVVGENRIQDAKARFSQLLPCERHFIGSLQTNKVKTALKLFDMIESVDRPELALALEQECDRLNQKMPILIEVNAANDPMKRGIKPAATFEFVREIAKYWHLEIRGLMTVVPYFENSEDARPYFRLMKSLFELCRRQFKGFEVLSMGMSHDFQIAIEEGATEVRIGGYFVQ
jgi:hypothetical protein